MKKTLFVVFTALICFAGYANKNGGIPNTFERPQIEALKALRATVGKPFSSGYVFVDGRYINPPYTVQRYGNVIRINGIQVTGQIIPWGDFVMTQSGAKVTKSESTPAAETVLDEEPQEAPKEEPKTEKAEESSEEETSLDDLFADEPAETKKASEPVKKPVVQRPKPQQPVVTTTYSFEGEFKHNTKTISYIKAINNERSKIEMNLRKGGYYFFGSRYKAVSGNASMAKYVINKLPPILKANTDSDSCANALRSAGLSYLPVALMDDLYRNRFGYIMLERRLKSDRITNGW